MSGQWTVDGWHDQDGWSTAQGEFTETVVNADDLMGQNFPPGMVDPRFVNKMSFFYDYDQGKAPVQETPAIPEEAEPPLLEELGIDPEEITKNVMLVLNPFNSSVPMGDYDLAGPLIFCLFLAVTMLLSGGKVNFSYVYSLALISCLLMYALLWLMTPAGIALSSVASVLGYCLLPVVLLSSIGIFLALRSQFGYFLALGAVLWASLAASRIFVAISDDKSQRPLIAYPCAILYAVFTLLVIF